MRFVRTLISLGFLLFGAAVVVLAVGAYLTATGRSAPVMRNAAAKVGELTVGQTTEQMAVSVSLEPSARRIDGVARLRVKTEEGRRRLYFLLDDGLSIREVWRSSAGGDRTPLPHYRLWLLVAVDLGDPVASDEEVALEIAYGGDPASGLSPFGQAVLDADEVILSPADLWYPTDMKSFFRADVEVTLPKSLTPVHAGTTEVSVDLGSSRRVRWTTARAATGVSLVAGRYRGRSGEAGEVAHRAFLAEGIDLAPERILESMAGAFSEMSDAYGASGASRQTVVVSRRLRRPFADGAGVIGLLPSAFSGGDYGFAAIADGIARTWWGGTVAANPTAPQDRGAWVVEGFAANGTRRAVRSRFGSDAEFRWRSGLAFDPTSAGSLAEASWIDWQLDAPGASDTRNKAAYVAMMLQNRVGDSAYEAAARELIQRFRGASVTTGDVESTFSASTGVELAGFFGPWVDSIGQVDLSLDPKQGGATVANHQEISPAAEVDLWRVPPGGQPLEQKVSVGAATPLGNAERLVVDPSGMLADMYRSNNVLPREDAPRTISRSIRGEWMIIEAEPYEWSPAVVRVVDAAAATLHVWNFDRGLLGDPQWSADGTHILAVEPPSGGSATVYALHPSDGSMTKVGEDEIVYGRSDSYVAARSGRISLVTGKESREVVGIDGGVVGDPRISPDGKLVAYTARRAGDMEIAVVGIDAGPDRVLMTWPSGPVQWQWSPDSSRLFAVLRGDWDWQLWEVPLDGAPRPLMREAAGVRDLAVSSDGKRIALAAQAEQDYRFERYQVFLIDRDDPRASQSYTVGGGSAVDVSWRDEDSLFVIVTDPTYSIVPARRDLKLLQLSDGSVLPVD